MWKKPKRPNWMSKEEYANYPETIQIREFKVSGLLYVTTFLKAKTYHKQELAMIYKRRWDVEINLNSIKTVMAMDYLSSKTPEMVKKEIGIHFLAYNMIKNLIVEACLSYHVPPWTVSFKGTLQLFNQFTPHFFYANQETENFLYQHLLRLIVKNKIGNRPGRIEPRAVKQKPKSFPALRNSRTLEKQRLLQQLEKKKAC
jgi:Transposase DDE domain